MKLIKKNIVFDGNMLYFISYHRVKKALGVDVISQENFEFFIKHVLMDVFDIINTIPYNQVIFVFDSNKESWRTDIYPQYKGNRETKDEVVRMIRQILLKKMRDVFSKQFQVFVQDRIEGDDLLYIVKRKIGTKHPLVLVTKDHDIYQLIDKNTAIYDYRKFVEDIDITYLKFEKLLLGDAGDNIKRVLKKGIGPKKLESIYISYGRNLNFLKGGQQFTDLQHVCLDANINYKKLMLNAKLILLDERSYPKKIWNMMNSIQLHKEPTKENLTIQDFM